MCVIVTERGRRSCRFTAVSAAADPTVVELDMRRTTNRRRLDSPRASAIAASRRGGKRAAATPSGATRP
jgi:hypothetical protein